MTAKEQLPEYLLCAQHGWADTGNQLGKLARAAANPQTKVIVPSLGLIKTFIRLQPLVLRLEQIVTTEIARYPQTKINLLGHSMGGLIWLELLKRHPEWWNKIHSLILLGSPVGGSNLARIIDPGGIGIGTAADLGKNRRSLAANIAQHIPTLSVASDTGTGTDGLVTVENTKFDYANWQLVSGIAHSAMRYHAEMIPILQNFWLHPRLGSFPDNSLSNRLIRLFRNVPGMTDADYRGLSRSQTIAHLPESITVRTWQTLWGVKHVYLVRQRDCLYSGYVGLTHIRGLERALKELQKFAS
ncbi:MAG: alpha/beta hydrolase [Cyanobacteria bacterium J06623_7]